MGKGRSSVFTFVFNLGNLLSLIHTKGKLNFKKIYTKKVASASY